MSDVVPPAPVQAETPVVPAAKPEPTLPPDMPVHRANVGLPRDPATGKFLPKDAAPAPAPEKPEVKVTPAAPAETPKAEPLSDRFAILAKKERAIVEQDRAVKARAAELDKREAALKSGTVPTQDFKEKPLQALAKQLGVSIKEAYDLVTQQALNGFEDPATPAEQAARLAREEVEQLRAELRKEREAELERAKADAKAQEQQVLNQFRQECVDFLATNKDKYELTSHFATGNELYQLVDEHWRQQVAGNVPNKRVLTLDEAAQLLEEHFEKQVESGLKLKKVSAKVQPAPTTAPAQRTAPSSAPAPALSNKLASSSSTSGGEAPAPNDRAERLRRAIAAGEAHRTK